MLLVCLPLWWMLYEDQPNLFLCAFFLEKKDINADTGFAYKHLKQVLNGFKNSAKLDFWHLLKLPPPFPLTAFS